MISLVDIRSFWGIRAACSTWDILNIIVVILDFGVGVLGTNRYATGRSRADFFLR